MFYFLVACLFRCVCLNCSTFRKLDWLLDFGLVFSDTGRSSRSFVALVLSPGAVRDGSGMNMIECVVFSVSALIRYPPFRTTRAERRVPAFHLPLEKCFSSFSPSHLLGAGMAASGFVSCSIDLLLRRYLWRTFSFSFSLAVAALRSAMFFLGKPKSRFLSPGFCILYGVGLTCNHTSCVLFQRRLEVPCLFFFRFVWDPWEDT